MWDNCLEEFSWTGIDHFVGVGDRSLWCVRDLVDYVRKHCIDCIDTLLSDLGDDLVEGLNGVWGRSVCERCKVAILWSLKDVLVREV